MMLLILENVLETKEISWGLDAMIRPKLLVKKRYKFLNMVSWNHVVWSCIILLMYGNKKGK